MRTKLIISGLGIFLVIALSGCPRSTPSSTRHPKPPHNQILLAIVDQTASFAKWLQPSLETFMAVIGNGLKPGDIVCIIGIDDDSYEDDDNVLFGPLQTDPGLLVFSNDKGKLIHRLEELKRGIVPKQCWGTDIEGALHLAADYAADHPDCWVNLLIFSDMVQQHIHDVGRAAPQRFPAYTRVTCLFVPRAGTEQEYRERKAQWRETLIRYGVPTQANITFWDTPSSRKENLSAHSLRDLTRPPQITIARVDH